MLMNIETTERDVVRYILRRAFDAHLVVRVDDGEEQHPVHNVDEALDLIFNLDESTLRFRDAHEPEKRGAIFFVINGGTGEAAIEVICDHAVNDLTTKVLGRFAGQ